MDFRRFVQTPKSKEREPLAWVAENALSTRTAYGSGCSHQSTTQPLEGVGGGMTILTGGCHRGRGGRGRCGSPRHEADGGGRRHLPRHPDPAAHFPLTISNVGVARQLGSRRWGYWDLNPDQRVSTAGRGCLATLYDLRVIAPVSRHWSGRRRSSADPLAIIPVTGARDAAWLHYIPIIGVNGSAPPAQDHESHDLAINLHSYLSRQRELHSCHRITNPTLYCLSYNGV